MGNYVEEIELNRSNVFIKNPERVNDIIRNLVEGGLSKLQVVSDFDQTLTKQHENGTRSLSSFALFEKCPSVPDTYKKNARDLYNKYRPIEVDPTVPLMHKKKCIEEWYMQSQNNLKGIVITQKEIEAVCNHSCPALRDGTTDFLTDLSGNNVPVLVFSAGLGDMVTSVLKHYNCLHPTVKVISNFLKYDDGGVISGFQNEAIHVLNKNEYAIKGSEFYEMIADRDNVILMGDHVGDAGMCEGINHLNNSLKIGFLYDQSKESLPSYMDSFDIVLVDDQTMDVARAILSHIK